MSSFTNSLVSEYEDGNSWRVYRSFAYHVGSKDSDEAIVVPEGFVTDYASVPWAFRGLIPKSGKWAPAAVVHDYLYSIRGRKGITHPAYSRKRCDEIFLEAMEVLKVAWVTRHIMFQAVRKFGWLAWNQKEE